MAKPQAPLPPSLRNIARLAGGLVQVLLLNFIAPLPTVGRTLGSAAETTKAIPKSDGQHEFDFEFGTWRTHLRRRVHPLSGSTTWVDYEGTTTVRPLWQGRANLVELEVDGPTGHIEALSLRLYNRVAHQWSLNFASSASGTMAIPAVGQFHDDRGEFIDQEVFGARSILVRFVITKLTPTSCHFEQAYSDDGGKTWEVNWIADDTRFVGHDRDERFSSG